jgi:glycopeptide antibiotics resistance protein
MIRGTTKTQKISWLIFILYLIAILYYTIFAESMGRANTDPTDDPRFNLILFNEINRFIVYREQLGMKAFMLNVVGNCVAFIPGGFLLPVISRRCRSFISCTLVGFVISFFIECTQLIFRVGSFDVDDLMLNTLGVAIGFIMNAAIKKFRAFRKRKKESRIVKIRKIG